MPANVMTSPYTTQYANGGGGAPIGSPGPKPYVGGGPMPGIYSV